jgi:hypothetical protein
MGLTKHSKLASQTGVKGGGGSMDELVACLPTVPKVRGLISIQLNREGGRGVKIGQICVTSMMNIPFG